MAGQYFVGIDGGTESIRAGVFDPAGTPLAFAATPYETHFPKPGWAEQDPADWWDALGKSVRKAVADSGVSNNEISAICADTTCCSVVALDADGHAVRPALIWMDVRAVAEAQRVAETGDPALGVNSDGKGPVSAEWMIPKALWLKENEPANFERASTICEYQDYINFHLTGRRVASINNAAVRWHYMAEGGGYQSSLLEKLGLGALQEKWPQEVLPLGEVIGGLTSRAAEHLGLQEALPVAQGGADAFIAMIGLGVVRPGKMAFITGSSHLHLGLADHAFHGQGIWGTYADALLPGYHVVEGGQTSTGSIVAWLKRLLDPAVSYDQLNAEAAALPPGSDGLIVQDHFQGNRTPHTDPLSRGAITGLTLSHGRAHLFRAMMEGVAYGTELILETQRAGGYKPDELVIAGGVTNSDLWMQIHADVSGLPLTVTRVADAPALGSAILAATAGGAYASITEASEAMVHVERRVEPDMSAHDAYRPFYEAHRRAYQANRAITDPLI
ncbi:FGGY-family carbohydrate kinase [Denitrobaculum tricleocarpae]|uniref:Carbohydrate kinase n=1 Tax=Denitrobaculum tricleocarpae TaxID=2591009 RepID=A0A545STC5_9PROT|nr:FGGY-family carbohydrate kinase [Denitrobaculum tricleocarpae]TQV68202.1 carbohydrate kinase [Denitrobaculum tricleocarpae]